MVLGKHKSWENFSHVIKFLSKLYVELRKKKVNTLLLLSLFWRLAYECSLLSFYLILKIYSATHSFTSVLAASILICVAATSSTCWPSTEQSKGNKKLPSLFIFCDLEYFNGLRKKNKKQKLLLKITLVIYVIFTTDRQSQSQ